jgi:cell wall-associated NlpC family hydrolase
MKHSKWILLIVMCVLFVGCGGQKKAAIKYPKKRVPAENTVITHAKTYLGTPYLYGGNTRSGIDCSGLIHQAFSKSKISVPRTVNDLKKTGSKIAIKKVRPGDVLFFKTSRKRTITHAGLVVRVRNKTPEFIHASTSRGVIISSLSQAYWNKAFVEARRLVR